jgi:CheY-like chemotaxis protein
MIGYGILYVEDDESDLAVLRHAFRLANVDIPLCHVPDGQVAVEYLTGQGTYQDRVRFPFPSILLVDVKMPRMGGLELLQWVRARPEFASLVAIMFSSSDHESDVRRACQFGANSYVVKPHGLQASIKLARALENWWFDQNEFTAPNFRPGRRVVAA